MKEEKILVTKPSLPPIEEFLSEVKDIWHNEWLTNKGPKHEMFSEKLKDYFGVKNISLFVNGHVALETVLEAFKIKGEVITTPFTFVSTVNAIVRTGSKPIFCDIKEDDYTIDEEKIRRLITKKTTAILPVHVYGNICDYEKIDRIAKEYHLKVIYDAAHAFGVKVNGVSVASLGDASMLSFHATKVFNSIEGGCVVSDHKTIKDCDKLNNFGLADNDAEYIGTNAKMNEFQSAMGLCSLRYIDKWIECRKAIVEKYDKILSGVSGIKLNKRKPNIQYNYAYYPVVFDGGIFGLSRDVVVEKLNAANIYPRKYFYPLINQMKVYKKFDSDLTPVAKSIASKILTLPLYSALSCEQADNVAKIILKK